MSKGKRTFGENIFIATKLKIKDKIKYGTKTTFFRKSFPQIMFRASPSLGRERLGFHISNNS